MKAYHIHAEAFSAACILSDGKTPYCVTHTILKLYFFFSGRNTLSRSQRKWLSETCQDCNQKLILPKTNARMPVDESAAAM